VLSRIAIALFAAAVPLGAQSVDTTHWSSSHPAYSEDQAVRGEKAYQAYCASCHTTGFHTGDDFRFNWFGRTVYDFFRILKTTMPEDNVGGLSDDDYTRVIAYILKLNGFPAGADSLRADSLEMRRIRIGSPSDSAKISRP
jgi:S-disulfanyl-L-cysteine oxidoreductase SoxD